MKKKFKEFQEDRSVTQSAAPASNLVKILTGIIFGLTGFFVLLGLSQPVMLGAAVFMAAMLYIFYLYAPVQYEIREGSLIIHRRINTKTFDGVHRCSLPQVRFPWALRTWGNGGLFSFSGRFWNRSWGTFYAYLTDHRPHRLLLVETRESRVLISPLEPRRFLSESANPEHSC